jgi:hypothetical protein
VGSSPCERSFLAEQYVQKTVIRNPVNDALRVGKQNS